ncbi:MAG: hypothetical protein LBM92_06875 [Opitutaceae bacterium]|jgi:hypothetical protein|nr:hypothetical protein [Opitutaceae bacterium]
MAKPIYPTESEKIKTLQRILKVKETGEIDDATVKALKKCGVSVEKDHMVPASKIEEIVEATIKTAKIKDLLAFIKECGATSRTGLKEKDLADAYNRGGVVGALEYIFS